LLIELAGGMFGSYSVLSTLSPSAVSELANGSAQNYAAGRGKEGHQDDHQHIRECGMNSMAEPVKGLHGMRESPPQA
jgi:hypothetical protein